MLCAVGLVVHTQPQGNDVYGVTSLGGLLYVIRDRASQQISVYDVDSYRLQRRINVSELEDVVDMAACEHDHCLYISDTGEYIHSVALPDAAVIKWPVYDVPAGLSVTDTHSVLVTFEKVRKMKEFTTHGKLLRQIELPQSVVSPCHAIQLSSGEFIVCHGRTDDPVYGVCLVDSSGQVVKSYGGSQGSDSQQTNSPSHLAVDKNGFVFVADIQSQQVLLLSPALTYVRDVVSHEQLKWYPFRLFLDDDRRQLYVIENECNDDDDDDKQIAGRLVVINV